MSFFRRQNVNQQLQIFGDHFLFSFPQRLCLFQGLVTDRILSVFWWKSWCDQELELFSSLERMVLHNFPISHWCELVLPSNIPAHGMKWVLQVVQMKGKYCGDQFDNLAIWWCLALALRAACKPCALCSKCFPFGILSPAIPKRQCL